MVKKNKLKKILSVFIIAGFLLSLNGYVAFATPSTYYSNSNIRYGFDDNNSGRLWIITGAGNQIFYGSNRSSTFSYLSINGVFYNITTTTPSVNNSDVNNGIITKVFPSQAGVVTSMRLSPVNNGNYVKYEITLTNNNSYAVNAGFKEFWDTQVNGKDASPIEYLSNGNGFRMYNGSVQLTLLAKNTFNVTDVTSMWAGYYGSGALGNFNDVSMSVAPGGTFSSGDSALYFKWAETNLPANSSRTYSVIVGAGALNQNPIQNATSPSSGQSFVPGQTITLTGTMSDPDGSNTGSMNISYGIDGGSQVSFTGVTDSTSTYNYNYQITLPSNISIGSHTLNVWATDKEGGVSAIQNIPINIIDNVAPTLILTQSTTAWTNGNVSITANGTDNIGVTQIQTPSGLVNGSSTTYTVGTNGTYTFVAKDGAGNTTSKSISITNIDKSAPTLQLTPSTISWVNGSINITATGSDTGGSGVKSITLPNNTIYNGTSTTYSFSQNGTYEFIVTDNAGNQTTQNITISNIDTDVPSLNLTQDTFDWTSGQVVITATGTDTISGVKSITLPDKSIVYDNNANYTITTNGTYEFIVTDNAGNVTTKNITISNTDTVPPTMNLSLSSASWSNNTSTINVTTSDVGSGVKNITLPNGSVVDDKNTCYTVIEVGVYYFTVSDNVGNTTTSYVVVGNIDKEKPNVIITHNQDWTNANSMNVNISAVDN